MLDQKMSIDSPNEIVKKLKLQDMTEQMGNFIDTQVIMSRRTDQGGCADEILGPQGTGKTSLMLSYACRIMEENPDEIIIWRDSYQSPCMFNRLKNWEIFAEEGTDLEFRDISTNEILNIDVIFFKDYYQLEKMISPQQLNVVYVKNEIIGYIKLINFFRRQAGWQSIFIDEYEDIAPINESGIYYKLIGALGRNIKNIRKGLVSLFCNTQDKSSIDWRVRPKFMCYTYLPGAMVDGTSEIYQQAVNALEVGQGFVSWFGKFGKILFPGFIPNDLVFEAVDKNKPDDLDILLEKL